MSRCVFRVVAEVLTQNHGDGFHQVEDGLAVVRAVLGHVQALVSHVDKDAGVHGHHDEECEQVQNRPEDQEAAAVERSDGGAVVQVALAVPQHGGHQAHGDAHGPDADDQQHHPALAHLAVQLHGEDGLVALHGHGQQVGHRGREADVDQGPADVPLLLGERAGPGARVQHQVGVGDAGKQVRRGHVAQEIVDGEVEAAVHEDGHHHHEVGQHHDATHRQAQSEHRVVPGGPGHADPLTHPVVEEGDVVAVVAGVGRSAALHGQDCKNTKFINVLQQQPMFNMFFIIDGFSPCKRIRFSHITQIWCFHKLETLKNNRRRLQVFCFEKTFGLWPDNIIVKQNKEVTHKVETLKCPY